MTPPYGPPQPPGRAEYEHYVLDMLRQLRDIQAEEHRQAKNLRTLIWVLFWLSLASSLIVVLLLSFVISKSSSTF